MIRPTPAKRVRDRLKTKSKSSSFRPNILKLPVQKPLSGNFYSRKQWHFWVYINLSMMRPNAWFLLTLGLSSREIRLHLISTARSFKILISHWPRRNFLELSQVFTQLSKVQPPENKHLWKKLPPRGSDEIASHIGEKNKVSGHPKYNEFLLCVQILLFPEPLSLLFMAQKCTSLESFYR